MEFDPLCAWHTRWAALPSALDARRKLTFTLVLKAQNMARIRDVVSSVSDPASVRYGRYLSQEQIAEITDPSREHVDSVRAWLAQAHVPHRRVGRASIVVETTLGATESLLKTRFALLRHRSDSGLQNLGAENGI